MKEGLNALITLIVILVFALIILSIIAFSHFSNKQSKDNVINDTITTSFYNINYMVIDSCEYIQIGHGIAHKGNCRFCKERRQKELEELVIKLKEK